MVCCHSQDNWWSNVCRYFYNKGKTDDLSSRCSKIRSLLDSLFFRYCVMFSFLYKLTGSSLTTSQARGLLLVAGEAKDHSLLLIKLDVAWIKHFYIQTLVFFKCLQSHVPMRTWVMERCATAKTRKSSIPGRNHLITAWVGRSSVVRVTALSRQQQVNLPVLMGNGAHHFRLANQVSICH